MGTKMRKDSSRKHTICRVFADETGSKCEGSGMTQVSGEKFQTLLT